MAGRIWIGLAGEGQNPHSENKQTETELKRIFDYGTEEERLEGVGGNFVVWCDGKARMRGGGKAQFKTRTRKNGECGTRSVFCATRPVIKEAAGEARKTTAPETSTGSPMRWTSAMRSK